ncbi:hypothetical protein H3Z85_16100 [Chryseobacterium indologenes]|uniref:DUF6796 family protein n=1 Tax=Chryseobacterium TaxID=59732 RepID=UPI0003E06765|nr:MULTISPECIES: DUF6796 family protein [Chryseobacterium]ASE60703.1 hypothetical protein CEQ15_03875 [Chryseobacterium indologenes]ATN04760.1 hypothetical protein CRN76_04750 [Chryseobacterium indologenes]AYY86489.1 hypothetical protein EGX91_19015 [Chryseobacterium indologenes]QIX83382.1 hypothetical protein FOB56_19990 [Chryseobacterium indologenes]QPQ50894.1 hypothetical protein H3Z85_16100 [Chryseobacterium indologenes]
MKYSQKINWSFAAAIIVSLCWLIGDIFVAGFDPDPADYPLFSKTYADQADVEFATLMLEGSASRLMFGALIGALTGPLLLPATWLVYQFFKDTKKWYAVFVYWVLLVGAVLSPLGHAGFFYVGEIYKAVYHTDPVAHSYLLETGRNFMKMLNIAWGAAIGVLAIGWISFAVCILLNKTLLPRWMALLTPFILTLMIIPLKGLLPLPYSGWVGGAIFNIAYTIFFSTLLFLFRKRLVHR